MHYLVSNYQYTEQTPTSHGLLYKSRVRTEPTNATAPQWTAALWSRLEALGGELADCCIKVYTLEKVLQQKKDTVTQTNFMDEAMKVMMRYDNPSFDTIPLIEEIYYLSSRFWKASLARHFGLSSHAHLKDNAKKQLEVRLTFWAVMSCLMHSLFI